MKAKYIQILVSCLAVLAFSTTLYSTAAAEELVVFSGRKEPLIKPVIDLFTQQSGVKVILKTGKSAALGQQILQEQPNPTADIYIAKESGSLEYLRSKGAFEAYESDATKLIPIKFKASDNTWLGVSGRSRAVIYNTELIKPEDVPTKLHELIDPKYKGKIAAVNAGNESMVAWVSALRIYFGDKGAEKLLNDLKANDIQLIGKSHTDIRKAIGRGEFPLGLINHYYYHLQRNETDESLRNVGVVYLDQDEDERGEMVNVSGAAIVKGAKHLTQAQQFMDFLASQDAQKLFAEVNFEYPLAAGVETKREVVQAIGCDEGSAIECLRGMVVYVDELGEKLDSTIELLERVNWY